MSRYVFSTLPSNDLGLLTRSLPIAEELRRRGHEVTFCNPAPAPARLISEARFANQPPAEPLLDIVSCDLSLGRLKRLLLSRHALRDVAIVASSIRTMARCSTADVWDIDHFMYLCGMGDERFVRLAVEAYRKVIRETAPSVVVDFWNPFACIAAMADGLPLITVIQSDMHPCSRGFLWWKEPAEPPLSPVAAVNRVLAEHGLPPIDSVGQLLLGDRTLVLGMPETDPLPDGVDVTYVGPILWQHGPDELPSSLANLDPSRPLVWLYPGNLRYVRATRSFGDSGIVLEACLEALAGEPVQVVLTTGHHGLPHSVLPLPDNFRHLPFVPGLAMARASDLLIHHGGYGSCQTGLYTGTPSLVIPTYSERESNARRIEAVGAGGLVVPDCDATGRVKLVDADEVRKKARALLRDPSYTANARRLSERMRAFGGAAEVAGIIERAERPRARLRQRPAHLTRAFL